MFSVYDDFTLVNQNVHNNNNNKKQQAEMWKKQTRAQELLMNAQRGSQGKTNNTKTR